MADYKTLGPFLGAITSIGPIDLDQKYAADLRNVRIEDGRLTPRYGYNVLSTPTSPGSSVVYHFKYYVTSAASAMALMRTASGSAEFGTSTTRQEFYISVEQRSGVSRPYFIDPSTLNRYEITENGSHLALYTGSIRGYWRGFSFDDTVYLFNQYDPTYPLATVTLGATGSWAAVKVPNTPGQSLSQRISVVYAKAASGFSAQRYRSLSWGGLDASTEIEYSGCATATNSQATTNTLTVAHTANASGDASFEIDMSAMSAGTQDWRNNDCFTFTLTSRNPGTFEIKPYSVRVSLTNADALPVTGDLGTVAGANQYGLQVYSFFGDKDRTLWDNTKKLKVSYSVSKTSATALDNRLDMSVVTVGGIVAWPGTVQIGYSWLNTTFGYESGVGGVGTLDQSLLRGSTVSLGDRGTYYLGTIPRVTVTDGSTQNPVPDQTRLYIREGTKWRRIAQQSVAQLTYYLTTTIQELESLDSYQPSTFAHNNLTCAAVYRNAWVVWGYDEGDSNIRHSRIGEPIKLASESDVDTDLNRGADFVLGDTTGDVPRQIITVDNVIFIFGDEGVYAQIAGDNPSSCTPPKRIAGAPPLFGPDSLCKWKDDQGRPGVAYMARGKDAIFFITVSNALDFEVGQRPIEITENIRGGVIQSFLFSGSPSPNPETLALFVDAKSDALWAFMVDRALVYRRPSLIDGHRQWELYTYPDNGYDNQRQKFAVHHYWGIRGMRLDGTLDEFEYDSTAMFIPKTGANRDGGTAMSSIYWKSKTFYGWPVRTRLFGLQVNKALPDTPTFTVTSTENSSTVSSTASGWNLRFSPLQKGYEHSVQINLSEGSSPVSKVVCEFHQIGKRRQL